MSKYTKGKHTFFFFADFLKDPNCETVCKRTKLREHFADEIHKVTYTVATKFGEIITADHKVFKEEGESRKKSSVFERCTRFGFSQDSGLTM